MNFNRPNRIGEPADPPKTALKPAIYDPPAAGTARASGTAAVDTTTRPAGSGTAPTSSLAASGSAAAAPGSNAPESRLFVGVHIKLKGVEISDCDTVVIEGNVEATVHSKALEIAKPGTLHGTADIDVAEIHGEFQGELTVRTRLIVRGTGRVSGTIRYGKLVVEEGGELTGDVKRRDESADHAPGTPGAAATGTTGGGARAALAPSSERWSN